MINNRNPKAHTKWLLSTVVLAACISIFVGIRLSTNAQMTSQTEGAVQVDRQISNQKRRTIRYDDPLWREKMPLSRMTSESVAIAIVTTVSNVGRLTSEPQGVDTVYKVRVIERIKGSLENEITVSLPGGLALEADGGLLSSQAPSVASMFNNKTYVLFLTPSTGPNASFSTLRASQGIYELPADGSAVIHLGSFTDPLPGPPREEQGVFLETVRRLSSN